MEVSCVFVIVNFEISTSAYFARRGSSRLESFLRLSMSKSQRRCVVRGSLTPRTPKQRSSTAGKLIRCSLRSFRCNMLAPLNNGIMTHQVITGNIVVLLHYPLPFAIVQLLTGGFL